MLSCKHCSTPNSLDSTFCKKCGTAIPADQRREASLQLDKLVDEGLTALNAGRTSEALAIADSAVTTDPTHLGALHLKSAVHERRGEIADALESAERIVELNPDSELDRIKRNGLRTSLLNASTTTAPDRRIAFAAAAAAMVLVACAGILIARKPSEAATTPPTQVAQNGPANGPIIEPTVKADPNPAQNIPVNNVSQPTYPNVPDNIQRTTPTFTDGDQTHLPSVDGTADGPLRIQPIQNGGTIMPHIGNPGTQPTTTSGVGNGAGINPTKKPDDGPEPTVLTQEKPDTGSIDIQISGGGKKTGGSEVIPESRTNGSAAYAQVGTERFQLGDYAGAATNLEKAVSGGGNPVSLNLMLAQAYGHLGRNSDAAGAYERSKAAANAALASGKGDRERLQAQRDAADAGLKTVRGS